MQSISGRLGLMAEVEGLRSRAANECQPRPSMRLLSKERTMNSFLASCGKLISRIIQREVQGPPPASARKLEQLVDVMQPGDVLLLDGVQKVSVAIKYLTQSTWSHAALYVGKSSLVSDCGGRTEAVIEVDLDNGCQIVPLSLYSGYNLRICRPHGLSSKDRQEVVQFMYAKLGIKYDLRNILDLARYLLPTPPVPVRWRRRMIALGSGDPTKAICSSLIAQAFQSVGYPILPAVRAGTSGGGPDDNSAEEIFNIRHHSLFAPRDFDLSPYFSIIKPALAAGFDHRKMVWAHGTNGGLHCKRPRQAGTAGYL